MAVTRKEEKEGKEKFGKPARKVVSSPVRRGRRQHFSAGRGFVGRKR